MMVLSIVIPAYNEENGIREIAKRVLAIEPALREIGLKGLELLVVDDGSKDRTAEVASNIPGVTLIRHPHNRGYGAALKTGFSKATGELIAFLDADGTYPPEYFPKLCCAAMNGADLVIGSRMAGEDSKMHLTRRVGNFFFANLLCKIQCGFKSNGIGYIGSACFVLIRQLVIRDFFKTNIFDHFSPTLVRRHGFQ